jgi:hypothetical protein
LFHGQVGIGGVGDLAPCFAVFDHRGQDRAAAGEAKPAVRVRIENQWHNGVAHPMPEDDAVARLATLPRMNSAMVRALGTNLLTIRDRR